MATTTIKPIESSRATIYGLAAMAANAYGVNVDENLAMTLNTMYGVFATQVPKNPLTVRHITYGYGGAANDSNSLVYANTVSGLNGNLFNPMAVRAVPLAQDLTNAERAKYGLRKVELVGGQQYAIYYASALDFTSSTVQLMRKDPTTGILTTYTPDSANMTPTPLSADANGVVTDPADVISVVIPATLTINGSDVIEVINALYSGNMQYARITEYGQIASSQETVTVNDANDVPFSYTELIGAQLASHYTWGGFQVVSESSVLTRTINITLANFAIRR